MATTLKTFSTTINCGSCLSNVTGFLDDLDGVAFWRVDLDDPRRVLSVEGPVAEQAVIRTVRDAGYDIEPLALEEA